jgi:hypothetical protein
MRQGGRGDGLLRQKSGTLGHRLQVLEILDRERAASPQPATHLDARRREFDVALLVVELDRQAAADRDAVDLLDEVEEPVAAVELAVGADLEPGAFLQGNRVQHRPGFDRAQIRGRYLALFPPGAGFEDLARAQQAADHVGLERRFCGHVFPPGFRWAVA